MIKRIQTGMIQENCYIVEDGKNALIIDPGSDENKLIDYIEQNELSLKAILLTHGHFDHIGAIEALNKKYRCPLYLDKDTIDYINNPKLHLGDFAIDSTEFQYVILEKKVTIDCWTIDIFHTPGHAKGSVMYYFKNENAMFTGDTLFKEAIGRYDLPGSSIPESLKTIEMIKQFDFDCIIYPGHGDLSTLVYEKNHNPFLK